MTLIKCGTNIFCRAELVAILDRWSSEVHTRPAHPCMVSLDSGKIMWKAYDVNLACTRPMVQMSIAQRTDFTLTVFVCALHWRHNENDGLSNHQPHDCLLKRLFKRRSKKTSKLRVTGLCVGNSPVTGEFPTQRASNAESVSIWWRHDGSGPMPGVLNINQ